TDVIVYPVETLPADISVVGTGIGAGAGGPVQTGTSTSTVQVIAPAPTSTKAGTVTTTKSDAYTLSVGFTAATVSFMLFNSLAEYEVSGINQLCIETEVLLPTKYLSHNQLFL
ncbi:hypothetical protein HDU99_007170, partial [Rhizoclosmatium hyalinum]